VSPGRNGDSVPWVTVRATRFSALQQWINSADADYDIGCIQLSEPLADTVGYFKIASLSDSDLTNALVNVSGYPGDPDDGRRKYFHANRVLRTSARRVFYDVDTYGGQSGSPVWVQSSPAAEPQAIAVHAYGTGGTAPSLGITANSGPRLSAEIVATVKEWLQGSNGVNYVGACEADHMLRSCHGGGWAAASGDEIFRGPGRRTGSRADVCDRCCRRREARFAARPRSASVFSR
jgi:glutamyl endopeptidase